MATIRRIAFIAGIALIVVALLLSEGGNANLGRPSAVRLALAGAGTIIAVGALMIRVPVRKVDGDGGDAKPAT